MKNEYNVLISRTCKLVGTTVHSELKRDVDHILLRCSIENAPTNICLSWAIRIARILLVSYTIAIHNYFNSDPTLS